jgi:UDP-glucose 4-epimerase
MFTFMLGKFGLPKLPRGATAHLKYPIVIDARAFREASGFQHVFDEYDTLRDYCAVDWEERHPEEALAEAQSASGGSVRPGATGADTPDE